MENTVEAAFASVRAGLRGVVVPFEVPGADHLAAVHLLYMSMVTIEAVPGRGPLASAPVLEDVVLVAVAVGTPPLRAIVAASNAIRTALLSTPSACLEVGKTRRACEWITAKFAAVGEVRSSLPRGPGSEALQRPGDAIDPFGHLYVYQPHTQLGLLCLIASVLLPLAAKCAPTQQNSPR